MNFDTALKSCVMVSMNPSIPFNGQLFKIFSHWELEIRFIPKIWKALPKTDILHVNVVTKDSCTFE